MPAAALPRFRPPRWPRARTGGRFSRPPKLADPAPRTAISGRRYYSPNQGRFLGRDPIQEEGGLNLYGFCRNNSINTYDILGQVTPEEARQALASSPENANLFLGQGGILTGWHPGTALDEVTDADQFDLVLTRSQLEALAAKSRSGNYFPDGTLMNGAPNNAGSGGSIFAGAGAAALDSGSRYSGAVIETFKFWKWPQDLADFAGSQVGSIIYDTKNYFSWDNNVAYLKQQFGTAEGLGSLAGAGLVGVVAPQVPQVQLPTVTVSPTARLIIINTIDVTLGDGTILGKLPDPRTANPPVPPPVIILVIETKPPAGAGPGGKGPG